MNNIGIANNEKLLSVFNELKSGELVLRPSFQRNLVWNNSHKESFIDTILRGLPFPEIYLADGEIDLQNQKSTRLVVDGQQRLDTIYSYVLGKLELKNIKAFNSLAPKEQTDFFDYTVVVRNLGRLDDDTVIDIFKRINPVRYALNAMEINNALYEGAFIEIARNIQSCEEFEKLSIFSETQYSRMKDLEFVLLILATLEEGGYFGSDSEIETYIKKYDNEYPNGEQIKEEVISTIKFINSQNLSIDSLWLRKSSVFSLIVEVIKLKRNGLDFSKINFKDFLESLENKIITNKNQDKSTNDYAKFYNYIYQGTAGKQGRTLRGELISSEIYNEINKI